MFSVLTLLLCLVVVGALLAIVEVYLHGRYGVNAWGYRGPAVGRKLPGERRVAVLGGSTAWGYGVRWDEAFPAQLERRLNAGTRHGHRGPVTVLNLAFNNEGALSFHHTLRDYEYLEYDAVVFYTGYNDLGLNTRVFRHRSSLFRLTGVLILSPGVFADWAKAVRYGPGRVATVFTPNLPRRIGGTALDAASNTLESLERQIGRLTNPAPAAEAIPGGADCPERWHHYCAALQAAVEYALAGNRQALVVTQPYVSDQHVEQQRAVVGALRERFGADPRFRHVNLGTVLDLRDRRVTFDGVHLDPVGNGRIAENLVAPVQRMLDAPGDVRP